MVFGFTPRLMHDAMNGFLHLNRDEQCARFFTTYGALGQVSVGRKYWSDESEVSGGQYGYGFDQIDNRVSTSVNGRAARYTANGLNQYTQRRRPGRWTPTAKQARS